MESFNIGRTLSRTFELITSTLPSVGVFLLIVQIINAVIQFVMRQSLSGTVAGAQASGDPAAALAIFTSGWYWTTILFSLALGAFSYAGSMRGLIAAGERQPVSLADCFGAGVTKLLPTLGLLLLWGLGVGLGWMLLIVPGVILMTMWSVTLPALVGEDLGVFASFGRSRELTKGSRMMIFVTLLVFIVVFYVVLFMIMGAIVGGSVMGGLGMANAMRAASPVMILATIPIGWLSSELIIALLASIYLETVTIKSGGTQGQLNEVFS